MLCVVPFFHSLLALSHCLPLRLSFSLPISPLSSRHTNPSRCFPPFLSCSPNPSPSFTPSSSSSPSHAVSTLVSCLPSRQPSPSATAFEKVLIACSDTLQLRKAYETFTCMTLTHGLAPTRPGLQGVARLLCSPLFSSNHQWRRFRLAFAFRILEGQAIYIYI